MKFKFLFVSSLAFSCLTLSSATVTTVSGGADDFLVFRNAAGGDLSDGFISVGAFEGTPPSVGIGFFDIEANFIAFGDPSPQAGFGAGDFANGVFSDNVEPSDGSFDFRGLQIFALVTNSDATEFAFFTADDLDNWVFPQIDDQGTGVEPDSTSLSLPEQNNLLAGSFIPADSDGNDFDTIQLSAIPEPSSVMFLAMSSLALLRRRSRK